MRIIGANIFVEENGDLYPTDLMEVSQGEAKHYFIRDLVTDEFTPLCCYSSDDASARLQGTMAKPFTPSPESAESFEKALKTMNGRSIKSHLEKFMKAMAEKDLLGQEE